MDLSKVSQLIREALGESFQPNHPSDLYVALIHASLLSLDFRLVCLGDHFNVRQPIQLPDQWNALGDVYSLRYKHDQSALNFCLKCVRIGPMLSIQGYVEEDAQRVYRWELDLNQWHEFDYKKERLELNEGDWNTFSEGLKNEIVQKWIPGLAKPGYEESRTR
jgi:proteasome inhibitor subunit 1 (PI31)